MLVALLRVYLTKDGQLVLSSGKIQAKECYLLAVLLQCLLVHLF